MSVHIHLSLPGQEGAKEALEVDALPHYPKNQRKHPNSVTLIRVETWLRKEPMGRGDHMTALWPRQAPNAFCALTFPPVKWIGKKILLRAAIHSGLSLLAENKVSLT